MDNEGIIRYFSMHNKSDQAETKTISMLNFKRMVSKASARLKK